MIISIYYVFHNEGEHAGCIWCVRLMGERRRCAGSSTRPPPKSTLAIIEMCRRAQEQHSYISTRQYRSVNSSFRCKACLSWNLLLWSSLMICIKKSFVMQLLRCTLLYQKNKIDFPVEWTSLVQLGRRTAPVLHRCQTWTRGRSATMLTLLLSSPHLCQPCNAAKF